MLKEIFKDVDTQLLIEEMKAGQMRGGLVDFFDEC